MVEKISRVLIVVEDNCWIGAKVKSNLRGQKPQISASMDPTALLELLSKVIILSMVIILARIPITSFPYLCMNLCAVIGNIYR